MAMKRKIYTPQFTIALFGAFAFAVLAFAQYRTSVLDSAHRATLARVLKMPENRPTWDNIEAKITDTQTANTMFDRMHRYYAKVFRDKYPKSTPDLKMEPTQLGANSVTRGVVPSAL